MDRFVRYGRRFDIPSKFQIIHELRMRMEAERVNGLHAELVTHVAGLGEEAKRRNLFEAVALEPPRARSPVSGSPALPWVPHD